MDERELHDLVLVRNRPLTELLRPANNGSASAGNIRRAAGGVAANRPAVAGPAVVGLTLGCSVGLALWRGHRPAVPEPLLSRGVVLVS